MFPCVQGTSLGDPVVPDVNMINASSSVSPDSGEATSRPGSGANRRI